MKLWKFFRQLLFPGMKHLLVIPLLLAALPASGAEFTVLRPQQSSITFVSKQMGVPVEGSFRKFTARIAVDPARPEAGTARIDIDLASIDTGNAEADTEVAGKAWFDTKNYPAASFVSGSVKQSGRERYEALGKMTIKGKTLDIRTPFTLKQSADTLVIDGVFPLKRLDYGIGSGIWSDTDTVADEVHIRFHFTVARK
ncbi:MAG TPA: YceI family protein [Gallionella sp.]|nr:YceI family protein [Gallionella sp.]